MRSEIDLCLHRIQQFHVDLLRIWGGVSIREATKRRRKLKTDKKVVKQTLIILIVLYIKFPRARPAHQ